MTAVVHNLRPTGDEPTSFDLLNMWSRFLSVEGKAPKTITAYKRVLVAFLADTSESCGGDLRAVTEDDVATYLDEIPRNGSMRGMVLRGLRSFYGWACRRSYVTTNPVAVLKPKNRKYGPAPSLREEDIVRLIEAAARREPRRAWVLILMYATGARIGSIVHVRLEDVVDDRITFRVAKNDDPYSVPLGRLGRDAVTALASWTPPTNRHKSRGTLVGVGEERVRQWFQQAQADSGVRIYPHLLRHTFATKLATKTDPRSWMDLMNHKDLSQFRRYVAASDERLKEAVENL